MAPTPQEFSSSNNEYYKTDESEKVVISGISGLYPESHSVKELSDILYNKVNPVNQENCRWDCHHPEVSRYSGKVPDLQHFDGQFFKVHYRLGNNMDSMARKILEQSYQAIYDAGICPEDLDGKKIGVYIGSCFSETEKVCVYVVGSTGLSIAGCSKSMFANRISYWLNVKGPSVSIDQACSSSTAALEQAFLAIKRGECEAAIVGGSNLSLHPQSQVHYGRILKLSMDGKTKSFDTNAAGCAKSEGINVLFLQKAKNARRVYAEVVHVKCEYTSLLKGEAGPRYGFYRDPENMANFIKTFYDEAKVSPQAVEYVEAFGSAVPEADKTELEALSQVYCKDRNDPLLVGSVMSNIGYAEAASGISAITKVLLGYQTGKLAGNLHYDSPRTDIAAIRDGSMRIITDHQDFGRTYTAVNGISVTGVNSHVLLNGLYKPKDLSRYKSTIPRLVTLSGRQESSVEKILQDLKKRPVDPEELALLHNIHQTRISGHLGRGFIILDTNEDNETVCLSEKVDYFDDAKRPLWFVYSGMGSQWAGMGAQLMRIPVFAAAIERCRRVLEPKGVDIVHIITSSDKTMFDNILHSFVGIAAVQIGLTDILRELGIYPDNIIGHSVGELGCAYADGCLTAEEMSLSAYSRGLVSVQTPFIRGSMAAVGIGYQQISKMCPPEIEVACHNGPDSSTISGPGDVMKEFIAQLSEKGIFAKEVPCSNIAYHSRYIAEAGPGLRKYLSEVIKSPKLRSERWVSTSVPQERWDEPLAKYSSAEYHTNNLLNPVLFEETSRLIPANAVVVEIAPHGLLQAILKRSLPDTCKHIALTRRGHPDNALFGLEAIGKLYMAGYNPKIQALYPKIEFPVSSGTPMLSHLVEWAHQENWILPLYVSTHRKTAAICKHTISIHDDDHKYLRGHIIRENNLYPFAAVLIAVWDTFSMMLGVQKKTLSVDFRDVHLYSQPAIHEQRQLRLNVTLHRGNGRFEVLDENIKVATGYIHGDINKSKAYKDELQTNEEMILSSDDIYQLLSARDYYYSDEFRSISRANLSLSQAQIQWRNNWVTLIDGMIQLNTLRRPHGNVSQPNFIRRMTIDVMEHENKISRENNKNVLTASLSEVLDRTRCGGVIMENIQYYDLSQPKKSTFALNCFKFVPHYTNNNVDEISALFIFLQLVAENLNKNIINVAEVIEYETNEPKFIKIKEIAGNIPGIKVRFSVIHKNNILNERDQFVADFDLVLVSNLAADNNICQLLYHVLRQDSYLVNKEENFNQASVRPSSLYRSISIHLIGSTSLELAIWRPIDLTVATSAFTVSSASDLIRLSATVLSLPSRQRLVVIAAHPIIPGLKSTIKKWRRESDHKISLVIINHNISEDQNLEHISFTDLAINILDHDTWGGIYYLPLPENIIKSHFAKLETPRIGDIDSLRWIESTESNKPGVAVTVHFAGVNDIEVKKAMGVMSTNNTYISNINEIYFSGTTDSGTRVMGIIQDQAISTRVKAKPELLWPVPNHWTLEDAATVPLAYCMAFYCLRIKAQLQPGNRIFVHGGAGALGQAVISIALAFGCDIFTTVSDNKKKCFLRKLFPELKDDHIGYSCDHAFGDKVLSATNGAGCHIVISCAKGDVKNMSLKCCGPFGTTIDTALIPNHEDFNFGMYFLTIGRNYTAVRFSSIFAPENIEELTKLRIMISDGIAHGYVRPLSRVTYKPQAAPRAFKLLAASQHRGRVLLNLQQDTMFTQPKLICSYDTCQLIISDNNVLGIQLAEKLVNRGAKRLLLHWANESNILLLKLSFWRKQGIQINVFYGNIWNENNITNVIKSSKGLGNIEGIYYISSDEVNTETIKSVEELTLIAIKLSVPLKYFAIIHSGNDILDQIMLPAPQDHVTRINLPRLRKYDNNNKTGSTDITVGYAVEAIEKAICSKQTVVAVHKVCSSATNSLLHELANIADVKIAENVPEEKTLIDLGMDPIKCEVLRIFLRDAYSVSLDKENVSALSIKQIYNLQDKIFAKQLKDTSGLKTFFSKVDQDELLATTEMIFLPTLTNSSTMRDDEFDASQTFLCIVPGVEGQHGRFRDLCECFKLPAIVLQPGLDRPHETLQDTARRYAEVLLKRTELKERFYLLGYESGVIVALEIAAILEEHGLTGTVYCIGGSPDEVQAIFNEKLSDFDTKESLQIAVAKHMLRLVTNDNVENLDKILESTSTWEEKIAACVHTLMGKMVHSYQYARELVECAYAKIAQVRNYNAKPRALRSLLISLRPKSDNASKSSSLQLHSQQPIVQYTLDSPLAYAANDLRCAAIVNRHLDGDILEAFESRNLCETYILNHCQFMNTSGR